MPNIYNQGSTRTINIALPALIEEIDALTVRDFRLGRSQLSLKYVPVWKSVSFHSTLLIDTFPQDLVSLE